jgi:DNA repair exonuclease SbcCD ATPase subunit
MKKYILIALVALSSVACKDEVEPTKDVRVVRERDSLMRIIAENENSMNDVISSFNEVEKNLATVREKQGIIKVNADKGKDINMNQKDRINEEIQAINDLMAENSKKINDLNKKLSRSSKKNKELQKTVDLLTEQLNAAYGELASLNEQLNSKNTQLAELRTAMDTLTSQNMAQAKNIDERVAELHTAYYVVGHSKELEKSKLIDKKGGIIGIGRTAKISDNVDRTKFTKIDYVQTTTIPVNSKNFKIITAHPTESYSLDKTGKVVNNIIISDPEKFWSSSKYLVVVN